MPILVTGASGFVANYLFKTLRDQYPKENIMGISRHLGSNPLADELNILHTNTDLLQEKEISAVVKSFLPDRVVHLAAQSSVAQSYKFPRKTFEINVDGTLNLLESLRSFCPTCRTLVVTSSDIYKGDYSSREKTIPIDESAPLYASTPYGASKIAQDLLAQQYFITYGLPVIRARSFPHTGPGRSTTFAIPSFIYQIHKIKKSAKSGKLLTGDLNIWRDYMDVRDTVKAYCLLLQKGKPGEAYNVCRGKLLNLAVMVQELIKFSGAEIEVVVDPSRLRKALSPTTLGNNSKLKKATGWNPDISLEQSLQEMAIEFN